MPGDPPESPLRRGILRAFLSPLVLRGVPGISLLSEPYFNIDKYAFDNRAISVPALPLRRDAPAPNPYIIPNSSESTI